jgi:hypothetical protein
MRFTAIVVAVDFDAASKARMGLAADLARRFGSSSGNFHHIRRASSRVSSFGGSYR